MKKLILAITVIFTLATVSYACGNEGKKSCSKGEGKACCKKDASAKKACAGAATADASGSKSCSKAKSCCKSKAMAATAVPADATLVPAQETPASH